MKILKIAISLVLSLSVCGCSQVVKELNDEDNAQWTSAYEENINEGVESDADISLDNGENGITDSLPVEEEEKQEFSVSSDEKTDTVEDESLIEHGETRVESDEPAVEPEEPDVVQEVVTPPPYVAVNGISLTTYDVTLSVGYQTMPYVTMSPADATDKGEIWTSSDTSVATVDRIGNIKGVGVGICTVTVTSTDNPEVFATVNVNIIPDTECTYINGILIANKTYPLPKDYAPGWDPVASEALNVMFAAAKEEGLSLWVCSGYRSYTDQRIIYNGYVARDGKEAADRYSARPGHSEHQTGLAFDINNTYSSFADTAEGKWLAENCYKYGFIIRYPKDKEHITGYMYEPWHVRYLGTDKAKEVYDSGLCLEEFLGITSTYSY